MGHKIPSSDNYFTPQHAPSEKHITHPVTVHQAEIKKCTDWTRIMLSFLERKQASSEWLAALEVAMENLRCPCQLFLPCPCCPPPPSPSFSPFPPLRRIPAAPLRHSPGTPWKNTEVSGSGLTIFKYHIRSFLKHQNTCNSTIATQGLSLNH